MDVAINVTATSPATVRALAPVPINFASDWRIVAEKPGDISLVNISDDVAGATNLRIASSVIADVFKGSELEAPGSELSGVVPSKKALSLLVQLTGSATDGGDVRYPYSAHLVLRIPYGANPDGADAALVDVVEYLLGALYETGETTMTSRLDALLHGALKPVDL